MLVPLIVILFSIGALLMSFFVHNTKYDRLLVLNSLNTHIISLMAFFVAITDTHYILDILIAYVCISFITSIAVLHFFTNKKV